MTTMMTQLLWMEHLLCPGIKVTQLVRPRACEETPGEAGFGGQDNYTGRHCSQRTSSVP